MKRKKKNISTGFWESPRTEAFTAMDRYLYLYLITNAHANLCCCYEISLMVIARETMLDLQAVQEGMERLDKTHFVVKYDDATKTVLIINGLRHTYTCSPKMEKRLRQEIFHVKNTLFQIYLLTELHCLHDMSVQAESNGTRPVFRLPPFVP